MGPVKSFLFAFVIVLIFAQASCAFTGTVELISPGDNAWTNKTNAQMPFVFIFTDAENATADCQLEINGAVRGLVNAANNTETEIYADADFSEGLNLWNIACTNGTSKTSETRSLFADRLPPSVYVPHVPAGGLNISTINFLIPFNYTDGLSGRSNCTAYLNGTKMQTVEAENASSDSFFSFPVSPAGWYEWWVNCTDEAGNTGGTPVLAVNKTDASPIKINMPENTTYYENDLALNFEHKLDVLDISYSLDGQTPVGVSGNTTFSVTGYGQHSITVKIIDISFGYENQSVWFTTAGPEAVVSIEEPEDGSSYGATDIPVNATTNNPAQWCGASLDGGSNMTMENVSSTSWYDTLSSVGEGNHTVTVWCNISGDMVFSKADFTVLSSGMSVTIQTPLNRTYWKGEAIDMTIYVSPGADACLFYMDSSGPYDANKYTGALWNYNLTGMAAGSHELLVRCNDSSGFYTSAEKSFTVMDVECQDNETGVCSGTEYCSNGVCKELSCPGCGYAENHTCMMYECCGSDDCLQSQYCLNHECIAISCECGEIVNHTCNEFECCSNFDCKMSEECDTSQHLCIKKVLKIIAPDSVTAGEEFEVVLLDNKGQPVAGAKLRVEYKSGVTESLTTDEFGSAAFIAKESGPVTITADIAGYDRQTATFEVKPGFDMTAFILLLIIILGGGTGIFYWKNLPELSLKKEVNGQEVTLRVKNRSGEDMENVLILDTVPRGAFISCGLSPSMEDVGNETHLTWYASLSKDEEIMIRYRASAASEYFTVRVGDDEYQSNSNPVKVLKEAIENIIHRNPEAEYPGY